MLANEYTPTPWPGDYSIFEIFLRLQNTHFGPENTKVKIPKLTRGLGRDRVSIFCK